MTNNNLYQNRNQQLAKNFVQGQPLMQQQNKNNSAGAHRKTNSNKLPHITGQ
jgi:hypothetical protein